MALNDPPMLDLPSAMAPASHHPARRLPPKTSIGMILLCLVFAACGTTTLTDKVLFEDARGTVSLETMTDQSIQATHPIALTPTLIAQILRGMEVQDQERGIQKFLLGPPPPVPVFSDDQIQFLAPLLAEGLRAAAPDQRIGYRVQTTHKGSFLESSTTETTAGSLYAYGRQLYVTLSQYRSVPARANLNLNDGAYRMNRPDSSGLQDRIVLFTPSAAQRSDAFDPPTREKSTDRFLAIDYQLLQEAPPIATTTEQTKPQMDRTSSTRESPTGTSSSEVSTPSNEALAQEVEALKKEMRSLQQQQLGNQPTKQNSRKRQTTPQQK
jgi:hypothetical protein